MKKILICSAILLSSILGQAQKHQTGVPTLTENESIELTKHMSKLIINKSNIPGASELPRFVDNSTNKYFPEIINQIGASCAQASGIGYIYNYELNFLLDRDAKDDNNTCCYMYAWNFVNEGIGKGSFPWEGWQIVDDNGIPTKTVYETVSSTEWMTGFDKYKSGMVNRVKTMNIVNLFPNGFTKPLKHDPEAMLTVKRYLYDHGNGSKVGGLVQFMGFADPLQASEYDGPGKERCSAIIPVFGTQGQHSMTIVGYNDDTWFDYTRDGIKQDFELGAFLCVNSWGKSWGDNGFFYAPYATFTHFMQGQGGTGNGTKDFYMVTPKVDSPKLVFKVIMTHTSRNDLNVIIGAAKNQEAKFPEGEMNLGIFSNQGGDLPMVGKGGKKFKTFEYAIDASGLLQAMQGSSDAKYFIEFDSQAIEKEGHGELVYCSLLDYRQDENNPIEYICSIENAIIKADNITIASVIPSNAETGNNINAFLNYSISDTKQLTITVTSKENVYFEADILNTSGDFVKNIFSQGMYPGTHYKEYDCTELGMSEFVLRISANNQMIYKTITL